MSRFFHLWVKVRDWCDHHLNELDDEGQMIDHNNDGAEGQDDNPARHRQLRPLEPWDRDFFRKKNIAELFDFILVSGALDGKAQPNSNAYATSLDLLQAVNFLECPAAWMAGCTEVAYRLEGGS